MENKNSKWEIIKDVPLTTLYTLRDEEGNGLVEVQDESLGNLTVHFLDAGIKELFYCVMNVGPHYKHFESSDDTDNEWKKYGVELSHLPEEVREKMRIDVSEHKLKHGISSPSFPDSLNKVLSDELDYSSTKSLQYPYFNKE